MDLEGEHNDMEEGEEQEGEEEEGKEEDGKEADGEQEEGKQLGKEGANRDQPNGVGKFEAILLLLSLTKVLQILTVAI